MLHVMTLGPWDMSWPSEEKTDTVQQSESMTASRSVAGSGNNEKHMGVSADVEQMWNRRTVIQQFSNHTPPLVISN